MWARVRSTWQWLKWTVTSWLYLATTPGDQDQDRPGDDDQFARWIDDKDE